LIDLLLQIAPQHKFDVTKMHQKGTRNSQTLIDDGTGSVQIWRIENFDMVPLDERLYGQFFGGDSYVILYTYKVNRKENYIVYFWQGQVHAVILLNILVGGLVKYCATELKKFV
jgi:hypothetical protein